MSQVLGYITPVRAFVSEGEIYMQSASGRVAEELAQHYERVLVCARVVHGAPPAPFDPPLRAPNLEWVEQPYWKTTAASLVHFWGIARAYLETCRRADALFIRGMCPYSAVLYLCAAAFRRPVCHWIVGDPVALLQTGRRNGIARDALSLIYALQDRLSTRLGRWLVSGALVCNGRELARAYRSPRTSEIVSSTVRDEEFFSRSDTCRGRTIRILFVGFIRPEKGIEYLLDAVASLPMCIRWELEMIGPREFPEYARKLEDLAADRGIGTRIHWSGYVPNGKPLLDRMRAADLLVLPSLSEGTPHVLVEARASGLPCIATKVGGVPSCVTDGHDSLLVPPKDSPALARAIERIVRDGELRRTLIRNGLATARRQTLDKFVAAVLRDLHDGAAQARSAVPQL